MMIKISWQIIPLYSCFDTTTEYECETDDCKRKAETVDPSGYPLGS